MSASAAIRPPALRRAPNRARAGADALVRLRLAARRRASRPRLRRSWSGNVRRAWTLVPCRARLDRLEHLEEHDRDVVLAAVRRSPLSTSASAARAGSRPAASIAAAISSSRDHVREPVGADQEEVAGLGLDRERVDLDGRLRPERARDRRALRVALGLLRRQHAALHELRDERVVGRELLELAVAQEIRARVADVPDADGARRGVDERDGDGRPHARGRRVVERALPDAPVRLGDERDDALLAAGLAARLLERGGREAGRDLASRGRRPCRRRPRTAAARR